jgi:signal transduction histidine kinase
VTERRRAEEALRFHEAILRETGRIAKVGGWTFEVVSGEGVWTEEVARIHDLDPDEPTNRDNGLKYYEPEDRRRLEAVLAESVAQGTPYDLELRIRTARGRRKWIRTIGHPVWEGSRVVRLRGSFQDITERKQAERRLATQAAVGRVLAEAATLADAAPRILRTIGESEGWAFGAIWRKDPANARLRSIEVWSAPEAAVAEVERMTRELSFGPGEGLPGQVWERRAPVLIPEVTRAASYPRAAAAEQAGLRGAIAFPIVVDGEVLGVIDFLVREAPEPDPALDAMFEQIGRQIGLFVQRRQAEDEVRRLNQELEQRVQRRTAELEAANHELEAFSYSVSHDLRAPLRAVDGFAQALAEDFGPALPDGGRRYLQLIQGGAQRMGNLIDDLLTLSRLSRQPLTLRRIEPARLVAGIWMDLASERGDRAIEFVVGDLPECRGDPSLLRQVWFNLLSNAVKYTGRQPQARIEVGAEMRADGPVFFVRDNGAGFDMRYVQKLFGVFQRLHRADEFSGTGVGLAIVQRLVHRHGGRVWAEGAVGQGAAFYFTLETR